MIEKDRKVLEKTLEDILELESGNKPIKDKYPLGVVMISMEENIYNAISSSIEDYNSFTKTDLPALLKNRSIAEFRKTYPNCFKLLLKNGDL
jgi:hypothetical protein